MLSWRNHYRETLKLALPVCLGNVGHITVDLADNFFIGQLPEKTAGQAAVSMAAAFYTLILVLLIGISYGLTPIAAEANAQGKREKIILHLRHAFIQNFAAAALLFILLFFSAPLLHYSGKPAEVTDLSIRFLNVMMLSLLPLSVFFTCKQFAEGLSDTRTAMIVTISANVLNIFLNWLLVFGHWGMPKLGVMGSCWSTFIARCFMALAMFSYIRYGKKYSSFREAFRFRNLSFAPVAEQLRIGLPSGLMFTVEVGAFAVPTLFIPETAQLAAHRVSLSLASMSYMISSGLGAAATIRVGHFLGKNDRAGMRRAGFSAVFLSLAFMGIAATVFALFRNELPALFNNDKQVLHYAGPLLLIAAAFQLFDGAQVTTQGALRGLKDTIHPGMIAFVAYWLVGLPSSYIFCTAAGLGVNGVWYGFILGLAAASAGFLWRFHTLNPKNRG
jgi:MATE family multidrug resistance protein